MLTNKKSLNTLLSMSLFSSLIKLASLLKVSFVMGSITAVFSAVNCVAPLSGALGGMSTALLVSAFGILCKVLLVGFNPFILAVYHLPGLFASLYLAKNHWSIRLFLPLFCMILFIIHPTGQSAFVYSLAWLIPAVLYFIQTQSFFWQALASTLTAHAVGSVLFLYTVQMSAHSWIALTPLALTERLVFAAGMTVCYHALRAAQNHLQSRLATAPLRIANH